MTPVLKNVIFDVGNVFVRWSPPEIIERCFNIPRGREENHARVAQLFGSPLWKAVNRGELTRAEAELAYRHQHGLSAMESEALFFHAMDHQTAVEGTENLALRLKNAGYGIYGLTDNVREIVSHSKIRHTFWTLMDGVVVSAEVGVLKPDLKIYKYLLNTYTLKAVECVFLDDVAGNVEGAQRSGMHALIFTDAQAAETALSGLGLAF